MQKKQLKELSVQDMKSLQLKILNEVDNFCKQHGLTYYIFAGTLIGAVRHKGYIPWDDDVDICMKREDYNLFFQQFNAENQSRYRAISIETESEYYLASGKVIDTHTLMKENTASSYKIGVYIDVFPMDYIPSDIKHYKKTNMSIGFYRYLLSLKNAATKKKRVLWKKIVIALGQFLLKPISRTYILDKISTLSQQYLTDHDDNFNLADISVYTYGKRELFPLSDFASTVELDFEDLKLSAPVGYDHVLSSMYGDYMKLPPKEKQISHHDYKVYWKE